MAWAASPRRTIRPEGQCSQSTRTTKVSSRRSTPASKVEERSDQLGAAEDERVVEPIGKARHRNVDDRPSARVRDPQRRQPNPVSNETLVEVEVIEDREPVRLEHDARVRRARFSALLEERHPGACTGGHQRRRRATDAAADDGDVPIFETHRALSARLSLPAGHPRSAIASSGPWAAR